MLVYRREIKMNSIHKVHEKILVVSQGKTLWVKKSGCSLFQKKKKKIQNGFLRANTQTYSTEAICICYINSPLLLVTCGN